MENNNMLGVMVDCSRNAVMSVKGVKRFIDSLEKMGYNTLMLYTEDTYEVDGEPFFGYLRGRYTKEEMREIDRYASSHGVELVPCIQTLAHLNAIFRWPEYQGVNDVEDILLADNDDTMRLIENMFSSLRSCVTTDKIHIGMDEAHLLGLGKYLDKNGFRNRTDILLKHLEKVCNLCKKYNFKPMMWSDMFFRLANGGEYGGEIADENAAKIRELIPSELTLVYWDYYSKDKNRYSTMIDGHFKLSENVAFAGGVWTWIGFVPDNSFTYDVTTAAVEVCNEKGLRNVLFTAWGDDGGECSTFSAVPMLFYAAELYRGNSDFALVKQKYAELFGEDFDLVTSQSRINMDFVHTSNAHSSKSMLYADILLGQYDTIVPDDADVQFAKLADEFKSAVANTQSYKLHFAALSDLADALAKKVLIGKRLRAAYSANDRDALERICENDLTAAHEAVRKYIASYRKLWNSEKKPHGFDVQEIRLGGLAARIEGARVRIREYLDGEVENIPELEENILRNIPFYNWRHSSTTNVL